MKLASLLTLGALFGVAAHGLAFAAGCDRPTPPARIDGASASMDQILAGKAAVTAFMSASDAYQDCIIAEVKAQRAAADAAKTRFDPAIAKAADAKANANQADKERVGAEFNASVKAFRAAHPS